MRTDNLTVSYWETASLSSNPILARWLDFLAQFSFSVKHISGKFLIPADTLSRLIDGGDDEEGEGEIAQIECPVGNLGEGGNPPSANPPVNLTLPVVWEAQGNDPACQVIKDFLGGKMDCTTIQEREFPLILVLCSKLPGRVNYCLKSGKTKHHRIQHSQSTKSLPKRDLLETEFISQNPFVIPSSGLYTQIVIGGPLRPPRSSPEGAGGRLFWEM